MVEAEAAATWRTSAKGEEEPEPPQILTQARTVQFSLCTQKTGRFPPGNYESPVENRKDATLPSLLALCLVFLQPST